MMQSRNANKKNCAEFIFLMKKKKKKQESSGVAHISNGVQGLKNRSQTRLLRQISCEESFITSALPPQTEFTKWPNPYMLW